MSLIQVNNKSSNNLPKYANPNDAGLDICANLENVIELKGKNFNFHTNSKILTILPGGRVLIPTGLYIAIPEGYHIDVRPRSGLALKQGLTVLNTPGLIDSGYRGELGVILINLSKIEQNISHGDRVAQLVLMKTEKIEWFEVEKLNDTVRGEGGFGSTGL